MDWTRASQIADVANAVAVVVSLLYLSIQVKQNTLMMRVNMKHEQARISLDLAFNSLQHSAVLTKWVEKEKLTPQERIETILIARASFRAWETLCYMHDNGLLDQDEWNGLEASMRRLFKATAFLEAYEKLEREISPRLRRLLKPIYMQEKARDA